MNDMVKVEKCEACRSAPCAVYCRADAAALCAACDADIHSANLLARRHHRVPILPVTAGGFVVRPSLNGHYNHVAAKPETQLPVGEEEDYDGDGLLFGEEVDGFLDLDEYNSGAENQMSTTKKPLQSDSDPSNGGSSEESEHLVPNGLQQQSFQYELASEAGGFSNFGYTASQLSHSLSLSSMEASIAPDNTMADISNSNSNSQLRPSKGTIDFFSGLPLQMPPQFTPMDREAKVLRYREKKKTRKFEKTIRYASRKAYAETRPRIKGRFAKRSAVDLEMDRLFSTTLMTDSSYGIVTSF